jgi:hypothetical protein
LAELVNGETFNLYSSFRRRNIETELASRAVLNILVYKGLIVPSSASVTLVRKDQVGGYIDQVLAKKERRKEKRSGGHKRGRRDDGAFVAFDALARQRKTVTPHD